MATLNECTMRHDASQSSSRQTNVSLIGINYWFNRLTRFQRQRRECIKKWTNKFVEIFPVQLTGTI